MRFMFVEFRQRISNLQKKDGRVHDLAKKSRAAVLINDLVEFHRPTDTAIKKGSALSGLLCDSWPSEEPAK